MEENLINREVQEELNSTANGVWNECCEALRNAEADKLALKERCEPRGEANQRDGENYVNRKCHGNICAGVEGLVSVDEESDNLSDDVARRWSDEEAESVSFAARWGKHEKFILSVDKLVRHEKLDNNRQNRLNNKSTEADNNEFDKLPEGIDTFALACGRFVKLI